MSAEQAVIFLIYFCIMSSLVPYGCRCLVLQVAVEKIFVLYMQCVHLSTFITNTAIGPEHCRLSKIKLKILDILSV